MKTIIKVVSLVLALLFVLAIAGCNPSSQGGELDFKTVYERAVELGFEGTLEDLIIMFKGDNAYEIAVSNGYKGSETEWLVTLIGVAGDKGENGRDGITPHIGENGHWWIGDYDTGVKAQGDKGEQGSSGKDGAAWLTGTNGPFSPQGKDGDLFLNALTGDVYVKMAGKWTLIGNLKGPQGVIGLSAYDVYLKNYPWYKGDEAQWMDDLVNGKLADEQGQNNFIEVEANDMIILERWYQTSGVANNVISINYPDENAVFELSVDEGAFRSGIWPDIYKTDVTLKNTDYASWGAYDGSEYAEHAFFSVILKIDNYITGYAVGEIYQKGSSLYGARLSKSVFFPKVDGERQHVTQKYIKAAIEKAKEPEFVKIDGAKYVLMDGNATLRKYTGDANTLTIPKTVVIDGISRNVSSIDDAAQILIAALVLSLNQQKRKYFWIRFAACAVIFYFFFVIFPGHDWWLSIMKQQISDTIAINHFYTFIFTIAILIVWFCYNTNFPGALFYGTCAYLVQHLASSIARAIIDIIQISIPNTANVLSYVRMFVFAVMVVAFYFLLTFSMKKRNSIEIVSVSGLVVSVFAIVFVAYGRQIMQSISAGLGSATTNIMIFYNIIAVFVCVIALFLLIYIYEKRDKKRENSELEKLLNIQGAMHQRTAENVEMLNIKAHDLKKQIEYMRNPENELEKHEILDGIAEAVERYDEVVESGCKPLDYVLTEKANICNKNNIIFSYMADGSALTKMKATDIYSLFSNAIDNAIECALKYGDEKRIITLKVMRQGKMTFIRIENFCDNEIVYDGGFPITTKTDKNTHGYGVKSINYLTQKYNGVIKIVNEHNLFSLILVLPL